MKGTRFINRFSENDSCLGKWIILDKKMAHRHDSGLILIFFSKILHNEGGC